MPVGVARAVPSDWDTWRSYYGIAQAVRTQDVTSYLRETVDSVRVDIGDKVEAGQVLITLAKGDHDSNAQARKTAYEEAEANYERMSKLVKNGSAAQADVERARTAMKEAQANVQNSKSALKRTVLRSEIPGVVTARHANPGEIAEAGGTLLVIEDMSETEARIMVAGKDFRNISAETAVRIIAGSGAHHGRVTRVSPKASEETGLYPVFVKLDPKSGIMPGSYVEGSFLVKRERGAIVIPASAVINRGGRHFVYVMDERGGEKTASLREVKFSDGSGERVALSSGLSSGDLVIVSGSRGLYDGAPVSCDMAPGDGG
ncbi:MAG: efflux RND transporter periplasmic adaptor subunit [Synergistaceae bacterium]|nr:efflux RND transporter periplasmic adaptor subunit [Synergistaceae bacterium]